MGIRDRVASNVGDLQTKRETKTKKGKAKEKEKTKTNHQTKANLQLGESLQVGKRIADFALTLSRESVKGVTNVPIGTNQHVKLLKKETANMVTTAIFPMQSQKLE